jgi:anti-sigma regulatory factor (Ser/Thr protein kinase)
MRTSLDVDITRDPQAPRRARRALRELGDSIAPDLRDDVVLLVSELVTNSVKYGEDTDLRLTIHAETPRRLRVEVVNQGASFEPRARTGSVTDSGGWGLHLVDQLADRWGVHAGSTHVWFEIDR